MSRTARGLIREGPRAKSSVVAKSEDQRWISAARDLVGRRGEVAEHLKRVPPVRFGEFVRRVRLGVECLQDVVRGQYRLPWATVGALTVAVGYFLMPFDVLPDFLPLTGFVDDAAMLAMVFSVAKKDLRKYCEWRGLNPVKYFGQDSD